MNSKENILNLSCLIVGLIFAFIGTLTTFENLSWGRESTATNALMVLGGFLILAGVIGYNIQSKK